MGKQSSKEPIGTRDVSFAMSWRQRFECREDQTVCERQNMLSGNTSVPYKKYLSFCPFSPCLPLQFFSQLHIFNFEISRLLDKILHN